ncbi:MAG: anaerobic magnesium-protoporphyrin IX monomethyl ester cyclase, partial [Pseudohongiellaceae bacterium]
DFMADKIVMYYPERGDPKLGQPYSADLMPLEFLHIIPPARAQGFEFVIIDSMVEPHPMERLWEELQDAFAFASTCIVGYQVADGAAVAAQVRERYPDMHMIQGGWFPSVAPQLYLQRGLADAVCIGQGEETFAEWLCAVRDGTPVEDVAGLALWRDGQLFNTSKRAVVPLDDLPAPAFDLIDVDSYLDVQEAQASTAKVRYRFPDPPGFSMQAPYRAISYFSSYGCPEACTFCCSPQVTGRAWKALDAITLVDRIVELKKLHRFDVVRFQDANFGVNPKRVHAFCKELIERNVGVAWNATIEVESIVRYPDETLDLMRDSGCHMMWVGAESATPEMQENIRKYIKEGSVDKAMRQMWERDIKIGLFWILGFPNETEASMRATMTLAAEMKTRYPNCTSEVLLYRPLPATESGAQAEANGYEMPLSFDTWGGMVEYKFENKTYESLPPMIRRDYHRYTYLVPWFDGLVKGSSVYHRFLRSMATWRLKNQKYAFPIEFKLYDLGKQFFAKLGIGRAPLLESRAAGVNVEGTYANVREG